MAMTLVLRVKELAYPDRPGITTTKVAEVLERRYGVMGHFYELRFQEIQAAMAKSLTHAAAATSQGRRVKPFVEAEKEIKQMFGEFLRTQALDGLVPGVPTQAARLGISHRFKHPKAKHPSRPSFIDTGRYLRAFEAKVGAE